MAEIKILMYKFKSRLYSVESVLVTCKIGKKKKYIVSPRNNEGKKTI